MKLSEVIRVPKKREPVEEPMWKYVDRLRTARERRLRQKQIGMGAYGFVFQHPQMQTVVVKVSQEGRDILKYLDFATKNEDNPYVPKVFGVRRFQKGKRGDKYFIVFLEKLNNYGRLPQKKKVQLISKHLGYTINQIKGAKSTYHGVGNEFFDFEDLNDHIAQLQKLRTKNARYLIQLFTYLKSINARDLHDGNIMLRGNDQLVFIDPIV